VTADDIYDDVSVLVGRGDGSFDPAQRFHAGRRPKRVSVADFDVDGRADLAVTLGDSGIAVLLGTR
jgi:hypothetical protein